MGNRVTVFRYRQQLVAAADAGFGSRHFTRQGCKRSICRDLLAFQHDINRFQELIACRSSAPVRLMRERRSAYFSAQAVRPLSAPAGSLPQWASLEVMLPSALIMPVSSRLFSTRSVNKCRNSDHSTIWRATAGESHAERA